MTAGEKAGPSAALGVTSVWARLPEGGRYITSEDGRNDKVTMTSTPGPQGPEVRGVEVDAQTRCAHWRSELDIVAIRMACCGVYWACKDCHEELAGHPVAVWGRAEWDARAVLCGACGLEMTIREYMECQARCPGCGAGFNPRCKEHWRFYFEE
jgi:uncharacterized CHY-type Zn-finger protein